MKDCEINILGTKYRIVFLKQSECPGLKNVDDFTEIKDKDTCKADLVSHQKKVLRHEIIHAFLAESGLDGGGLAVDSWSDNEEMVDWFAIQSPKIYKVFAELDIL